MTPSTLTQTPTSQEIFEITEVMCSTGVVFKPVQEAIIGHVARDVTLADKLLEIIGRHMASWNRKRWGELNTWHQMTAHAWFALQIEKRLIEFRNQVRVAKEKALAKAA